MQEKKKILYVITKGNFGGAQRYVYDLATNLSKSDFDIVVACGNKDGNSLPQKLAEQNIRTIILENSEREISIKNDFKTFREFIRIIKSERPNIVHLNSSKIGLIGAFAILYIRISYFVNRNSLPVPHSIFTSHGWAFNEKGRSAISKNIFYLGHYLTVLICDKTIAVSEKTKCDISFLPFIKNKMKIIYNGVSNFETFPQKEARLILVHSGSNQTADKEAEKNIIFSMSELHNNKGIDVALKALALLPNEKKEKIIYSIAGPGEEKENLEKLVSDLCLTNIVKFLGFIPDSKKLLSGADIFLLPSRTENLPFAVLEAGMAGLPIIATSVGGIPEIVHDMQNGILVHPKNPKEIAEAILYLLDHKEKQKEFGEEIKKTITNFFTLKRMVSETLKIYELKIN